MSMQVWCPLISCLKLNLITKELNIIKKMLIVYIWHLLNMLSLKFKLINDKTLLGNS